MFLLNAETEIVWELGPTATPPVVTDLDLSIIDPSGASTYTDSAIEAGRFLAPTDTLPGYASYLFTPTAEGMWKIQLTKGTSASFVILDKVEMHVFDNTRVSNPLKYMINTVPDEKSLTQPGILIPVTGTIRWYPTRDIYIREISLNLGVAPQGRSAIIDVKKNGSSMLASKFEIAEFEHRGTPKMPIYPVITVDDYITVDVIQRGSQVFGGDLFINFKYD